MAQIDDLKTRTDDQLNDQLGELKREQFNLRFQAATNQLEKPSRIREVRRTIARIRTLQNERARAASLKNSAPGAAAKG
ncbi:MAG: 50S ribosomal protein L29 [Pseudomonadota bacterium]|nr:50S ribosomal protein L29 [Pseudomonadota bacterium]